MSNPIAPKPNPNPKPGEKPADSKAEEPKKEGEEKTEEDEAKTEAKKDKPPARSPLPQVVRPPSPLQAQHHDTRSQPDFNPVKITILDGLYKGMSPDLGFNFGELSSEQSAEWNDNGGDQIRSGFNFGKISGRSFQGSIVFYSAHYDVSHLAENLAVLHQITEGMISPPRLLWEQGGTKAVPVVCESLSIKYEDPIAGESKGYHHASVDLSFRLLGGRGSPNAFGEPLASTPLTDRLQEMTAQERQKTGQQAIAKAILIDCIGEEGSAKVEELITKGHLNNPQEVVKLDANTFVQAAVGGLFGKEVLADPKLKEKLHQDLAAVMAVNEYGVNELSDRLLRDALLNESAAGLPPDLQPIYDGLLRDYKAVEKAISEQTLDKNAAFFNKQNASAIDRLQRAANCGWQMRAATDLGTIGETTKEDQEILKNLNAFLDPAAGKTDEEIKAAFGLASESQLRRLRNSYPYTSKDEFLNNAARDEIGITGYTFWHSFLSFDEKIKEGEAKSKKKD